MRYLAFSILFFAIFAAACDTAPPPVEVSTGRGSTNLPMPPAGNIETLGWTKDDGKIENLGSLKGKVVVLDFWATYCKPCLEEIPHLVALQEKHQAEGFQIVGLHVGGDEDKPLVPDFAKKLKMNYTIATPDDSLTSALMGNNSAIPQTFVFDRNGSLIKSFVGYDAKVKKDLEETIQDSLKK